MKNQQKNEYKESLFKKIIDFTEKIDLLWIFIFILGASLVLTSILSNLIEREAREDYGQFLKIHSSALTDELNSRIIVLEVLEKYILQNQDSQFLSGHLPHIINPLLNTTGDIQYVRVRPSGYPEIEFSIDGSRYKGLEDSEIIYGRPVTYKFERNNGMTIRIDNHQSLLIIQSEINLENGDFWGITEIGVDLTSVLLPLINPDDIHYAGISIVDRNGMVILGDDLGFENSVFVSVGGFSPAWRIVSQLPQDQVKQISNQKIGFLSASLLFSFSLFAYIYRERTFKSGLLHEIDKKTHQLSLDLEEKAQYEQQLSSQNRLLQKILHTSPEIIIVVDRSGQIIYANQMLRLFLSPDDGPVMGQDLSNFNNQIEITHAGKEYRIDQALEKLRNEHVPVENLLIRTKCSQGIHYFVLNAAPMITENKVFDGAVFVLSDRTEEETARNLLIESEKRYRNLVSKSPNAIFIQKDGYITYVNPTCEKMLGAQSADELIGMPVIDLVAPQYRNQVQKRIEEMGSKNTHPIQEEEKFLRLDGTPIDVEVFFSYGEDEDGLGTTVFMRDVSDRKRSQRLHIQYESLFRDLRDAAFLIRVSDGQILDANESASIMYGYDWKTMRSMRVFEFRSHEQKKQVREQIDKAILNGLTFETVHIRENGTQFPVEVKSQCLHLGEEQVLLSIVRDLTEHKNRERWLTEQMNRNRELYLETQKKNFQMEILADVSKEFRNASSQDEILPMILEKSIQLLSASGGCILMVSQDALKPESVNLLNEKILNEEVRLSSSTRLIELLRSPKLTYFSSDGLSDLCTSGKKLGDYFSNAESIVAKPLQNNAGVIGLTLLGFSSHRQLSTEENNILFSIMEMGAIAIQRMNVTERMREILAKRTMELEAIYDLISLISEQLEPEIALKKGLSRILDIMGVSNGGVFLVAEDKQKIVLAQNQGIPRTISKRIAIQEMETSIEGEVIQSDEPILINDLARDPRAGWSIRPEDLISFISVPMHAKGTTVGALSLTNKGSRQFNMDEVSLLSAAADHLALIVEIANLRKKSELRLIQEERSRLARELHDSVTQAIYSAMLFSDSAQQFLQKHEYSQSSDNLLFLDTSLKQALRELRLLIYQMRSPILDEAGFTAAIQHRLDMVEERAGIDTDFISNKNLVLPVQVEDALYWVCQEALNNSLKHSKASEIKISLNEEQGRVVLRVKDDGIGFDPGSLESIAGIGFQSMKERVTLVGGELQISSEPGRGTEIQVFVGNERICDG